MLPGVSICQRSVESVETSVDFAYLFPQPVKTRYFCSDPIGVDPICPQPIWGPSHNKPICYYKQYAYTDKAK